MSGLDERHLFAECVGTDGVWELDLHTGRLLLSARMKDCLGLPAGDQACLPADWFARVEEADRDALRGAIEVATRDVGRTVAVAYRTRAGAGRVLRWYDCRGRVLAGANGWPARIVGCQFDVTSARLAEETLRRSEERYRLAALGANDGLWDWVLATGEVHYSPRWRAMLGLTDAEAAASGASTSSVWFNLVAPADVAGLKAAIDLHLSGFRGHLEHECRMRHADGSEIWVLIRGMAVRDDRGEAERLAGSMTDITPRKRAEQQLLFDAFHDGMTALPNRTLLLDRIGQALDRNRRSGGARNFAVLLIDLDRFKSINDALGAFHGDQLLRTIAERLEASRRMGDTLARLSADEFSMLLMDIDDLGDAVTAAERLAAAVSEPIVAAGHDLVVTCCIGVALSATGYDRPEDMLRDTSLAVYRAKQSGRNRIDVFDGNLRRQAMATMRTEADLRTALEQNQLHVYYQPIIALTTGRIAGFEALLRWKHPERGLVSPAEFIPLAEDSGLIVPIGRWVLRESAQRILKWQNRFPRPTPLFMSVNVSSRQFHDDDLPDLVRGVLAETGIAPSSLRLEITESLLMQDPAKCRQVMQSIRDMDVRLSIDDFGTGYSSLSYLHKFPADTLKIDKSFVQAVSTGEGSAAIVQVITTLAAILGMDAVAEGVENEVEAEYLRDIMCKYAQGFLYARPMPAEDMEALLVREFMAIEGAL